MFFIIKNHKSNIMKKLFIENESPIAPAKEKGMGAVISGSADMYGACSIENFSSASSLSLTHEDAQGWIDYVTKFTPGNFWYKDAGVQVWLYEEAYDNWQDTYGTDAVVAFYHSGHGAMDGNGVFQAPLGSKWDNRDWAFSNRMSLGNETVRYLFWSTCFSLRVFGANNPIRTWHDVNQGFRMLFGYETTSVDNPNYGKFFWEEWNKGKSFSTAWLDASWRISHNQVPTAMATGINAAEAQSRLFNERNFYAAAGSRNYYQWRWYNAASSIRAAINEINYNQQLPPMVALYTKDDDRADRAAKVANALGLTKKATSQLLYDKYGAAYFQDKNKRATISNDGHINIHTGEFNFKNTDAFDQGKAVRLSKEVIGECGIDKHATLEFDKVIHGYTCSGNTKGSGKIGTPTISETIVQYRQVINGMKSINSGNGIVRVAIDNDGKVMDVFDSTKQVVDLSPKGAAALSPTPGKKVAGKTKVTPAIREKIEEAFETELNKILLQNQVKTAVSAKMPKGERAVIVDEKIGYNLNGGHGTVEAEREYEADLGYGLKKRYKIRIPIYPQ
jgi:hypothetical protein